jgi:hypothetical protein
MNPIKSILREILGLFVDDGAFALAILLCLALAVTLLPRIAPTASWTGPLLFAALALILIESTFRYARRKRK